MAIVIANSATELERQIHDAGDKLVLVMFTSAQCAACRNINPTVTLLNKQNRSASCKIYILLIHL